MYLRLVHPVNVFAAPAQT
jgi:hypothetical protein